MIDKNRGVTIKTTPAGVEVVEFKDQRGSYFSSTGDELGPDYARQAGFDVVDGAKARMRRELLEKAEHEIDAKVREMHAEIERKVEEDAGRNPVPEDQDEARKVAEEIKKREYRVEKRSGEWAVLDPDGGVVEFKRRKVDAETAAAEFQKLEDATAPSV